MSELEAISVGKRYRRRRPWALREVSFTLPSGRIAGLVGPNGAGKSTLIKGAIGLERPTEGSLRVAGVDPWRDRGGAIRRAGYVPQSPSLYRELSVAEHVAMAAAYRPGFDSPYAFERLRAVGIPVHAPATELSGGEQAQVTLALALGTRAPVLLLDEPLANLDPLARRDFLHVLVESARASGTTVLLTSHVVTDLEQACDHLLVLGGGRLLLDRSVEEARAGHVIVEGVGSAEPAGVVGRFRGPSGAELALVTAVPGGGGRPASLEEIVLGHLAAGRVTRSTADRAEEAAA